MNEIRLKAYLAAPLFNNIERAFNLEIEKALAPYIDVFLPQRDSGLMTDLIASGRSVSEARNLVFQEDVEAIVKSDIIIAVLDGRTIDEGVAFELGYGYALGKLCFGLKTDDRIMLSTGDNPMIVVACNKIFSDLSGMISEIKDYKERSDNQALYAARR